MPVCPTTGRLVCRRPPDDAETALDWWSDRPYGIAALTGVVFDALQLPNWLGQRVLPAVEHLAAVTDLRRPQDCDWFFLITPGSPRIRDLPAAAEVRLHGVGGLVLLPPTPRAGWVSRHSDLRLPHSLTMQWAVLRAITASRRSAGHNHEMNV